MQGPDVEVVPDEGAEDGELLAEEVGLDGVVVDVPVAGAVGIDVEVGAGGAVVGELHAERPSTTPAMVAVRTRRFTHRP
ncbi:hypothetical protein AZH51_07675 [Branchiibius sp. NY16-3462-2]|nr:hypothetical protein AZH51_07675 [Branchiibius sp. NY16-3462-2]